ncbi:DNA polymerase subunit beta [Methylobacterium brachiatum]
MADASARFLSAVDAALPGRILGLHVVGSAALDDFVPGRCDLDFIGVTADRSTDADLAALAEVHRALAVDAALPALDGIYISAGDWDGQAAWEPGPAARAGCFEVRTGYRRRAVDRLALSDHALTLRGPAPPVWLDEAAVTGWAVGALSDLRGRRDPGEADEAVLGACRLHYLLATWRIPSKSAAGLYGLITFEARWRRILDESLRLRRSPGLPTLYPDEGERRRDAGAFVEMAVADAMSLA